MAVFLLQKDFIILSEIGHLKKDALVKLRVKLGLDILEGSHKIEIFFTDEVRLRWYRKNGR